MPAVQVPSDCYWRVNTGNDVGVSPWSAAPFTVENANDAPITNMDDMLFSVY